MRDEHMKQGSWKIEKEEAAPVGFDLAAALASMGLVALAALVWINSASAAIAKPGAESAAWKKGAAAATCEDKLSSLYLAGSFVMPGSASEMQLWVGKPHGDAKGTDEKEVWGLIGRNTDTSCEALCKVTRFERFRKDQKPALMELDCEGSHLKTMRMPLHIQWVREDKGFATTVRLGSSIYGVEVAPLHLQVNRYAVALK